MVCKELIELRAPAFLFSALCICLAGLAQAQDNSETNWYYIDNHSGQCTTSDANTPSKLIENAQIAGQEYNADDIKNAETGRIVQTTIRFPNMNTQVTFFRGQTRCEIELQTLNSRLHDDVTRYGGDPTPREADKSFASPRPEGIETHANGPTAFDARKVEDEVRQCYSEGSTERSYTRYAATLIVALDSTAQVTSVKLSQADKRRSATDPAFKAFAERAMQAALDPQCSQLPLPPTFKDWSKRELSFQFRP